MTNQEWVTFLKGTIIFMLGFGTNAGMNIVVASLRRRKQGKTTRLLDMAPKVLIYVAVIGMLFGLQSGRYQAAQADRANAQAACQAQFATAVVRGLVERSAVATDDREAVRTALNSVGVILKQPPSASTSAEVSAVIDAFNQQSATNDANRPSLDINIPDCYGGNP